jgi:hypothetical protein
MGLQGTLDVFGLAEVLELLAATGKTGCLSVAGDGGHGEVWLRDGAVAAGSTDRVSHAALDEVICDLLRQRSGTFSFEDDERSPSVRTPEALHDLLDRADALLEEWRDLEEVVPSLSHRVRLIETLPDGGQVTVRAHQWHALVAVGGGCTVADLAARLELTELNALRTVHDLLTSGLTRLDPARSARPGPAADARARRLA